METKELMSERLQFTIIHITERRKFKITVKMEDVPNIRVQMLKKSIYQATGIPIECQALYLNKQLLSDKMTGSELKLSTETVFILHTSSPTYDEQLATKTQHQDNLISAFVHEDEKSRNKSGNSSRSGSRNRSRSQSRSRSKASRTNRRDTFGTPLFETEPKSSSTLIIAPDNAIENTFSPHIINTQFASRDSTLWSKERRKSAQSISVFDIQPVTNLSPAVSTKDCKKFSSKAHQKNTSRSNTQGNDILNTSVRNIVAKAEGRSSSQKKVYRTSPARSLTKLSYSDTPISYPRIQSAKSTNKKDQERKAKSPQQHGIETVSLDEYPSTRCPEPYSGDEYCSVTDSPPLIPTINSYTKTKVLTTSRISLTDLNENDRSYPSIQPEFPTKTTELTVPQRYTGTKRSYQSTLNISDAADMYKEDTVEHHAVAQNIESNNGEIDNVNENSENTIENIDEFPSFTEDDVELLRQMTGGLQSNNEIIVDALAHDATSTEYTMKHQLLSEQPRREEELALVSELQEQVTLIKQEMATIKRTIASTPTRNLLTNEQVSSVHILQGSRKESEQRQEASVEDWDLFKNKYDRELAALKQEVEQLRNARDSTNMPGIDGLQAAHVKLPNTTATQEPLLSSESYYPTNKVTKEPIEALTTDESINSDVYNTSRRLSNVTPISTSALTIIRNRQSDGPQRPPSAKILGITKSYQNSSLLAIQTIKQQIEAERTELTSILQNLEIYSLMDTFFDIDIEIANIEHDNMLQALEESKASLADIQTQLSYALSKTPTFTPDVRKSAELSLDYGMFQREHARLQTLMLLENKQRKILHNTLEEMKGSIRVIVRMRPMLQHEKEELKTSKFKSFNHRSAFIFKDEHTLQLKLPYGIASQENYTFDFYKVLDETKTQEDVFHDMSHLLKSVIDGYNVCVLAYGCTGSGKTFTLIGDDSETAIAESVIMSIQKEPEEKNPYERLGLLPRSIVELFNLIEADTSQSQQYEVKCAMIELYLDNILDLLHTEDDNKSQLPSFNSDKLAVRQTAKGETYIQNLSYKSVANAEELVGYLGYGLERRHIAATKLNSLSSRSHTVFLIEITSHREMAKGIRTARSVLTFADLAGSENVTKSHSNGLRLKEAQHINTSLCALGDVIAALSRKKVASYVPYRNNKLTMILQQSLGNNSKTLLFANISPLPNLLYETLSTLSFAGRVKNVKNVAVKNLTNIESD